MLGKRIVLLLCTAVALGAGAVGCGNDDDLPAGSATATPTSSMSAFEREALRAFCTDLQRQTNFDLATPDGAAQAVVFFDELLRTTPQEAEEPLTILRDSFQRVATAPPEQIPQVRDEIRQQAQAAFTALGIVQQNRCQGF